MDEVDSMVEEGDPASAALPVAAAGLVPPAAVVKGAFGRFLPAGLALSVPALTLAEAPWPALTIAVGVEGALLTGFGLALAALRAHLRPDAGVEGRKSVLAGLVAPLALFSVIVLVGGVSAFELLLYAVLTGAGSAIALFFPWIRGGRSPALDDDDHLLEGTR